MVDVTVTVDIVECDRARVAGPAFVGYVAKGFAGRAPMTNRPRYNITLTDDTAEHYDSDREPLPPVTRVVREAFIDAAVAMARRLANHYGYTDVQVELHDETGTHVVPQEV